MLKNFVKNPLNDTSHNKYVTYSVHFDKDVFQFIGNYLDTTKRDIEGIRLFQIQYDKILHGDDGRVPGQRDSVQYSVLFVPTKANRSNDWDAWKRENIKYFGALNHGELCPNNCSGDQ